ncbi:MAG: hypothetical protein U0271_13490 [Polyangiaceae bacterium]
MTLIGFLARRMPGEVASNYGVAEVRAALALCEARRAMLVTERVAAPSYSQEVPGPDSGERAAVAAPSAGDAAGRPKGSAAA